MKILNFKVTSLAMASAAMASYSLAMAHEGHDHAAKSQSVDRSRTVAPVVEIIVKGPYRIITSNALPDHDTGQFPNRGNPHTMSPQSIELRVPVVPREATAAIENTRGFFGIALNGVPFEPHTAEYWNNDRSSGWRMEVKSPNHSLGLDENNAHVQRSGLYHYHGPPTGLISREDGMVHVGWAADGYPIYSDLGYKDPDDPTSPLIRLRSSWQLKEGSRPIPPSGPGGGHDGRYEKDFHYKANSGDLDEFNGRSGKTPEFPDGTYYYVVTDAFPFLSRSFKGVPDSSFQSKGGEETRRGRRDRGGRGRGGPSRGTRRPSDGPPRP